MEQVSQMASHSRALLSRFRMCVSALTIAFVAVAFLVADGGSARADEERTTPVVGSFAVGGSVTAGVDERSGMFSAHVPLAGLPGVGGAGAASVGVSYSQDAAVVRSDRDGVGAGWGFGVPQVLVDGGVRVVTPSGQVFEAAEGVSDDVDPAEVASGLQGYVQGDLVFSQVGGQNAVLPAREGVRAGVAYTYSLEHLGGAVDYFGVDGRILARFDAYDYRTDWVWVGDRLVGVIDGLGSEIVLDWSDGGSGAEIVSPSRSDGVVSSTVLGIAGNMLRSITNPIGESVEFGYNESGLLERIDSSSGARTQITYQPLANNHLPNGAKTVDEVRVIDSGTGQVLSKRAWKVKGDHNPHGSPKYSDAAEMWASGDGAYTYETVLTDGDTSIESVYNSMGLMLSRQVIVSTLDGEYPTQEQAFTYTGTEHGGVPDKGQVPQQYAKPITTTVIYRNNKGATRSVSEYTKFDVTGRVSEHTAADGSVTTTTYDTRKAVKQEHAARKLPYALLLNQTTKGQDGAVSETTHTLTPDGKAIQATETRVAMPGGELERTSRTEFVVEADGFVSQRKVIATRPVAEGPENVVTRFSRVVNNDAKTVTVSQTDAAGTGAESTTSTVTDLVTGLELTTTDPTGRVATSTYDRAGRVLTQIAPGDFRAVTAYAGKVTSVTDPVGVTKTERVDVLGRVVEVTDNITTTSDGIHVPDPNTKRTVETRRYEQNGSTLTVTDARGLETVTNTDVFGRVVSAKGPSGVQQVNVYDDVANTVTSGIVGPSGAGLEDALRVTTTELDDSNRDIKTHSARTDGIRVPEQTTKYDGLGRVRTQTGGDVSTSVVTNPDGTPKTTTITPTNTDTFPGESVTADREHDLFGVSTKKTLARGDGRTRDGVTRVLDAAGRAVTETDQAGQVTAYEYTIDGLMAEIHETATGITTRNTYDKTTRALTGTETTRADGTVSRTQFGYHPVTGNMLSMCDPTSCENTRISYTYDVFGNTTAIVYPDGKSIHHTFDEFGRKTSTTDIVGNTTVYSYDRIGLLETVTQTGPLGTVLGQVEYRYDELGRTTELSRGNGLTTRYTFTSGNEIKTETTKQGQTVIQDAAYEYDPHGNLTQRLDTRAEITNTTEHVTETTTYAYNAYNQLIESRVYPGTITHPLEGQNAQPSLQTTYDIGVSGEVLKETATTDVTSTVREFEYNPLGQTTAITTTHDADTVGNRVTQTYDGAGNLTHAVDGTAYIYNVHNQPITETHPDESVVTNTYWVNGQRNTTTTNTPGETGKSHTATVGLYWDGPTLSNDTHTTNSTTVTGSYLIGASRHTRTLTETGNTDNTSPSHTDGTGYYLTDRHGNTTAITDTNGSITTAYTYTDYGLTTQHTTPAASEHVNPAERNPFRYASEYTTTTNKQLLGNRTFDPNMFGFTTKDNADQFDLYAYANSNPITRVDPSGQTPIQDIINGIFIGVTVIMAAFTIIATPWAAAGLAAWAQVGVAAAGIVADASGAAIAATQIVNNYKNRSGNALFSKETSTKLEFTEIGLGLIGLAGVIPAVIGKISREIAINKTMRVFQGMFKGDINTANIQDSLEMLGHVSEDELQNFAKFMNDAPYGPGGIITSDHSVLGAEYRSSTRDIVLGKEIDLGPTRPLQDEYILHEFGHLRCHMQNGDPKRVPEYFLLHAQKFRDAMNELTDKKFSALGMANLGRPETERMINASHYMQDEWELYADVYTFWHRGGSPPTEIYGKKELVPIAQKLFGTSEF